MLGCDKVDGDKIDLRFEPFFCKDDADLELDWENRGARIFSRLGSFICLSIDRLLYGPRNSSHFSRQELSIGW